MSNLPCHTFAYLPHDADEKRRERKNMSHAVRGRESVGLGLSESDLMSSLKFPNIHAQTHVQCMEGGVMSTYAKT